MKVYATSEGWRAKCSVCEELLLLEDAHTCWCSEMSDVTYCPECFLRHSHSGSAAQAPASEELAR
jgi:hypothetical protein